MIPKKNPGANLENKRVFFFLLGLALALLVTITAFQYPSKSTLPLPEERSKVTINDEVIPITLIKVEEPKAISEPEKPKADVPPEEKPDYTELPTEFKKIFNPGEGGEEPVPIELPTEKPEPIPAGVFLENLARPSECGKLLSSEEQLDCLNRWIQKYIIKNTRYPDKARRLRLEDKVFVSFVVSTDGKIEEVSVVRGEYPVLNEEALRVVKSVPEFIPARQLGQPVRMSMTVPVNFKLTGY